MIQPLRVVRVVMEEIAWLVSQLLSHLQEVQERENLGVVDGDINWMGSYERYTCLLS